MAFENERVALVSVGTDPVLVAVAQDREEFVITNASPGAEIITISPGVVPTTFAASGGIPLLVNSVYYSSASQGFKPTRSEIWAVCNAATGVLKVYVRPSEKQTI